MNRSARGALGAAALSLVAGPAGAHVTLAVTQAMPGAAYRGVLQVGHGCAGSPTTRITVRVPEGVLDAKPMPKPGWTVATRRGAYARAYSLWGRPVSEGVTEITWSGGGLPDDQYDEFTFVARIADAVSAGAAIPFPVVQGCAEAEEAWTQVSAPGAPATLPRPAPVLRILAAAGAPVRTGGLVVETPWARATPNGAKVAAGYLTVRNEGAEPDRLLGASMPPARRGEVHEMSVEGGVMRMRPVEGGLTIRPGESVALKPGGYHLMFLDMNGGLKEGEVVQGTLTFERAGTVPVTFQVGGLGAQGPAGAQGPSGAQGPAGAQGSSSSQGSAGEHRH